MLLLPEPKNSCPRIDLEQKASDIFSSGRENLTIDFSKMAF